MTDDCINILITYPPRFIPPAKELIEQIASIDQRINLHNVSELLTHERENDAEARKKLDKRLVEADIFFGLDLPDNIIDRAPRLKWIHIGIAGVDKMLTLEVIKSRVILTNSKGLHATSASELVLMMMLMLLKKAPFFMQNKLEKAYRIYRPLLLESKIVGILGLGAIGSEVARLAKAFKMHVIATRSNPNRENPYTDEIFPSDQMDEVLARSDFVVVALPFTTENSGLIGESELQGMTRTSFLINVARGGIVNEGALIKALQEEWIAGAGLDVFAVEPLLAENKLWELPNVILTPHLAGRLENYTELTLQLFRENIQRYVDGKTLKNVVNKKKGY